MEINPAQRVASLNARELAEFRADLPRLSSTGGPSRWRASVGQQWHDNLRKQAVSQRGHAIFEKTLRGTWLENGWQITLTGKVDQWIEHEGRITIREIKTISRLLPMNDEELLAHYPAYYAQLQAYLAMAIHLGQAQDETLHGELVFVSIAEGLVQTLEVPARDLSNYEAQRKKFADFLAQRSIDHDRLRSLPFNPPFAEWRPGQEVTLQNLRDSHDQRLPGKPFLFEAPTGFGKTGVALQFAIEQLRAGTYEKIFCLTSKSTGQNQILQQLAVMQSQASPQFFQLRNREEHAIRSQAHTCNGRDCKRDLEEKWETSGINPALLFNEGPPTLDQVRKLGVDTGICPYEISRALIPRADILVGDFNYVFSQRHNSLLLQQDGLPRNRILLIVDEAHNLPARVRESLSTQTTTRHAQILLAGLESCRAHAKILVLAERWLDLLQSLDRTTELRPNQFYETEDLVTDLIDEIINSPIEWDSLPEDAYEILRDLLHLKTLLGNANIPMLVWCERPGSLRIDCLDASSEIAETLAQFGGSLLMSATLSPLETFAHNCGQPTAQLLETVQAEAPWRKGAYRLAIDLRVDTRLKLRVRNYETTAMTIRAFAESADGPIATYFPSYEYAEAIQQVLGEQAPDLPATVQPRGLPLSEQNAFLQRALEDAKVLLLMMGGSFAEGIDVLGDRVTRAIIVGPALPVADTVQRTRMARLEDPDPEAAYHRICREPALIRIRQAIGRMVRAPGQHATILFHCCRFTESHYQSLFTENNPTHIRTNEGLTAWLASSRSNLAVAEEEVSQTEENRSVEK